MSAGSDPVVIVSAARTAIGECLAGSFRPATHLPVRCTETQALVTGRGGGRPRTPQPGAPRLARDPAPHAAIGSSQ